MTTPRLPSRYQARSLLGEGGSGRVYRVLDSIRDREVALKLVTPAESAWLRREFDTLRQIRHENLIQVFDWGALRSGEAYYTMELVEGGDWGRRKGAPQPADEVRRVLTGLLRGLAHLHSHGEIHGDLKPGNVLLGAGGVVKITDAGMGGGEGAAPGSSGTPGYAAPEVWEGAKADVRSDLYSVGVMAYEALAGRHPFAGRTARDVVSGQLEGWVPSPGAHGIHLSADIERVVMRAVERAPGLRQGSADEFMEGMGVEDRIGAILGGKLVGREKEIAGIEALLRSDEQGTPTLVRVVGGPGSGKASLLDEVCHRVVAAGTGMAAVEVTADGKLLLSISKAFELRPDTGASGDQNRQAEVAEALCSRAASGPLLIIVPTGGSGPGFDAVRALARFVWAISEERKRASNVLFVIAEEDSVQPFESFEHGIPLEPFTEEQVRESIQGVLGKCALEPELITELHDLTGGNPGILRAGVLALIDQRLIDRRGGCWRYREAERIQSLQLPELADPWLVAWKRLSIGEKSAVTALGLLASGIPNSGIPNVRLELPGVDGPILDVFAALESKGWIRMDAGAWRIASESTRRAVRHSAPDELRASIAKTMLRIPGLVTDREERVDLMLAYEPDPAELESGLWAAEQARARGNHRTASARLRALLGLAATLQSSHLSSSISFQLATALHRLGDHEAALRCLGDFPVPSGDPHRRQLEPRRENLLGEIQRSLGAFDLARGHFRRSIQFAEEANDPEIVFLSQAALAELDWRHGSETEREEAIARMRALISSFGDRTEHDEVIGNLTYQIGAGLVVAGRFAEATEVLSGGLTHQLPDFWRMRISNALASSAFYLGDFESALTWVNAAWEIAERSGFDSFKARILANRGGIVNGLGRPRDAIDQHTLAAQWARRAGDLYEYSFACAGAAFNLTLLARYEEALTQARESRRARERIDDPRGIAKASELEALALFYIGDYDSAESLVRSAKRLISDRGYVDVGPRLDWLEARLALARGDIPQADELLSRAESVLVSTKDWEDLPGVQIEQQLLRSRLGNAKACLTRVWDIAHDSRAGRAAVVQINAAGALAQILLDRGGDHSNFGAFIASCLERAELAGMLESSWYLSYALGEFATRDGDLRGAQTRFGHAIRTLREISSALKADHRKLYLARSHTHSAVSRLVPTG